MNDTVNSKPVVVQDGACELSDDETSLWLLAAWHPLLAG
jgi:hypothetical protein